MSSVYFEYARALISLMVRPRWCIPRTIQTIVIVQPAKLGDMVCTTPLIRATRASFPHARVVVLGDALNESIVAGNTDADRYIVYSESAYQSACAAVAAEKADVALIATPCAQCVALCARAGVRAIIAPSITNGYSPFETRTYRLLRFFIRLVPHQMRSYAPREYLRLLEPLGVYTDNTKKYVFFTQEARARVHTVLPEYAGMTIGFSVSAGNPAKSWPPEHFASVIAYVAQTYKARVVLFGAARDHARVREVCALLSPTIPVIDLAEQLTLDELKAAISLLTMFIALDTGPIYIAEALGVPTIDITGPVDPYEQPPQGKYHLLVTPPEPFEPATFVMNSREYDSEHARALIESISVERVAQAVDELVRRIVPK